MTMPKTTGFLISLCAAGAAYVALAQPPQKQLTARELFYSAAAAKPSVPRPQSQSQPQVATAQPTPTQTQTKTATRVPPTQTATATPPPPKQQQASNPRPATTPSVSSAPIINVADQNPSSTAPAPVSGPALGLKYTIVKRNGNDWAEVPASTVFRAGDRIQLKVEANVPGYLYIISQGSSGTWKPMFPSPEVEDGNNRVDGWRSYNMPPKSNIVFDEQTGTEKLFVVLSREPEPDLEKMIYSLQGGKSQPVATPETPAPPRQMVQYAKLNIDDSVVGRLRQTYSRDLIIEKVDPNTPGERKETAVYVVNPTGSTSSRVVADLSLVHK